MRRVFKAKLGFLTFLGQRTSINLSYWKCHLCPTLSASSLENEKVRNEQKNKGRITKKAFLDICYGGTLRPLTAAYIIIYGIKYHATACVNTNLTLAVACRKNTIRICAVLSFWAKRNESSFQPWATMSRLHTLNILSTLLLMSAYKALELNTSVSIPGFFSTLIFDILISACLSLISTWGIKVNGLCKVVSNGVQAIELDWDCDKWAGRS